MAQRYDDITGDIGDLYPEANPKIPMYSFCRPSAIFWQAIYEVLREKGDSHEEAVEWLQSKSPRHMLDGDAGDQIRELALEVGRKWLKG